MRGFLRAQVEVKVQVRLQATRPEGEVTTVVILPSANNRTVRLRLRQGKALASEMCLRSSAITASSWATTRPTARARRRSRREDPAQQVPLQPEAPNLPEAREERVAVVEVVVKAAVVEMGRSRGKRVSVTSATRPLQITRRTRTEERSGARAAVMRLVVRLLTSLRRMGSLTSVSGCSRKFRGASRRPSAFARG